MFEYFPNQYSWNCATTMAINMGGLISEIDQACRPVRDLKATTPDSWKTWCNVWFALADRVAADAVNDVEAGHQLSAAEKYRRAAIYNFTAERMMHGATEERFARYRKGQDCFRQFVALADEKVEVVRVPYQDTTLPALFVPANGPRDQAPCVIHFDGLDVHKELLYFTGLVQAFQARGISTLLVDHPGAGEALRVQKLTNFPETEKQVSPCVDYLEGRPDVQRDKIGLLAISLGGYYAVRAAAFEKRLACCVAWGAIWDWGPVVRGRLADAARATSITNFGEQTAWVFGCPSIEAVKELGDKLTLAPVIDKVTCPLLVVHGENDQQIPLEHATTVYQRAVNSRQRELKVFRAEQGGDQHCQCDNYSVGVDYMADWVADRLLGPAANKSKN
jgi:dienelactone hydrolase